MALESFFVRPLPNSPVYRDRLAQELSWLRGTPAELYIEHVATVCQHLSNIPFIIRGSAASSLVVFLTGISNIDPVAHNIAPERFFHPLRTSLPDIDLDFPASRRDAVFDIIYRLFPHAARLSNHSTHTDVSAIRSAVRRLGHRKRLPRRFLLSDVLPSSAPDAVVIAADLQHQVSHLSHHTGGVVLFNSPPPDTLLHRPRQLRLDRHEVAQRGLMKLDILSNQALDQLVALSDAPLDSYPPDDPSTAQLLSSGDSFGVLHAESPAFQRLLRAMQPRSLSDLAVAFAAIRPGASYRSHQAVFLDAFRRTRTSPFPVFEDDATALISRLTGLSPAHADVLRRAFAKRDTHLTASLADALSASPDTAAILHDLQSFASFSVCKSHAVSYAHVLWALAFHKAHSPKRFWLATLLHVTSTLWRPWVHVEQAKLAGLDVIPGRRPYKADGDTVYSEGSSPHLFKPDPHWELKKYGSFSGNNFIPGMYVHYDHPQAHFTGLVATHRILKAKNKASYTFATLGVAPGSFINVSFDSAVDLSEFDAVSGSGEVYQSYGSESIHADQFKCISF